MVKLCTKFEISTFNQYKDMKGDENANIWVVCGVRGHPRSSETSQFDRAHVRHAVDVCYKC